MESACTLLCRKAYTKVRLDDINKSIAAMRSIGIEPNEIAIDEFKLRMSQHRSATKDVKQMEIEEANAGNELFITKVIRLTPPTTGKD